MLEDCGPERVLGSRIALSCDITPFPRVLCLLPVNAALRGWGCEGRRRVQGVIRDEIPKVAHSSSSDILSRAEGVIRGELAERIRVGPC